MIVDKGKIWTVPALILVLVSLWLLGARHPSRAVSARAVPHFQVACDDPYETNETFGSAWPLSPGVIHSYICTGSDVDYYRFTAQAGDSIRLQLDELPADFNLCLFDPIQNPIACSDSSGTTAERIEKKAGISGNYYALVYGFQGAHDEEEPYRLSVQVWSMDCPDPYEPNETFARAWPLGYGLHDAYLCASRDQDWFRFDLEPLQEMQVILTNMAADYALEVWDPNGVLVGSSNRTVTIAEKVIFTASPEGGPYRARIRGVAGAFDPDHAYRLDLSPSDPPPPPEPTATPEPTPIPSCAADAYEPNGTSTTAATIPTGTEIHAVLCPASDVDWYTFAVDGAIEIFVELYDLPAAYEMVLYDPTGWPVASTWSTGTAPRELSHSPADDGDYLLRVGPRCGTCWDEDEEYALRVDLDDPPPEVLVAAADTYVLESEPASTHGDERQVIAGRDGFDMEYRGLFRFDLARVPAATIARAYFRLSLSEASAGLLPLDLRRVSGEWDEDTVSWDTQPWAVDVGVSRPVGSVEHAYYQWDVTDLVQGWLTGGVGNFGLQLRAPSGGGLSRSFRSSDYGRGLFAAEGSGPVRSPRLVIHFTEPDPGPLGSIAGRVFHDINENGAYDPGESGIEGVAVEVFRDRISQGFDTTGGDGTYLVDLLPQGDYEVIVPEMALPGDYELADSGERSLILAPGEDVSGVDIPVAERPMPPFPDLDLTVEGIEFLQVLRDQPLVAGKTTLLRVFVGATGTSDEVPAVGAQLFRRGHPLDPVDPVELADLLPSSDPMADPTILAEMDRTINFLVPDAWTEAGEQDFYVWVNPDEPERECPTCWDSDNVYYTWVHGTSPTFYEADPFEVTMVAVTADGISPTADPADVYRWLAHAYPTSEILVSSDSLTVTGYDFATSRAGTCPIGWGQLLEDLIELGDLEGDGAPNMYFYGMLDVSVPRADGPSVTYGCGRRPGRVAAGAVGDGWLTDGSIMGHEVGHNLGRSHTCGCSAPGCVDQGFDGHLGTDAVSLFNPSHPYIKGNEHNYDIMTYCTSRWPSIVTYGAFWDHFVGATSRTASASDSEYLVGSGHIVDGLVTMTRPFYRLHYPAGTSDGSGQGPFALRLLDAGGEPLFTRYFDTLGDSESSSEGDGYFHQIVPWQQGTAYIEFREQATLLLVTHVSANPPAVTLLAPDPGEAWPPYGPHVVSWSGSDADGDPLRYALQYSADNGATWRPAAANLVGTTYELEAGLLPGGEQALLRVIASDGVHTGQDELDGFFSVGGKPPTAHILTPLDGSVFSPGKPLVLEGMGTDLEEGPLTLDSLFTWSSSVEGDLGTGRKLRMDQLLPGLHRIDVRVADSEGFVSGDSVSILVGHRVFLPLVMR